MPIPVRGSVVVAQGGNRKGQRLSGSHVVESRPVCQANVAKPHPKTGEFRYRACGYRLTPKGIGLPTWHCSRHGEMHVA